jgi:ABC-type glutathione transport system ATPase component
LAKYLFEFFGTPKVKLGETSRLPNSSKVWLYVTKYSSSPAAAEDGSNTPDRARMATFLKNLRIRMQSRIEPLKEKVSGGIRQRLAAAGVWW